MSQSVIINNVTYNAVPQVEIPKAGGNGNAVFYDTSADTSVSADVLATKTFHTSTGSATGGMTNNGNVSGTISTVAGTYTIANGYHGGSGTVSIAQAEQSKIISGNIKSGVTILGVSGSTSVVDTSDGNASSSHILSGKTAYVNGSKLTGSLNTPSISQDGVTKVLLIE